MTEGNRAPLMGRVLRRAAAAAAVALVAAVATPHGASACAMCKSTFDDPVSHRLAVGYAVSILTMLAVAFALVAGGGLYLARMADPEGFARRMALARRRASDWRVRVGAVACAGLVALGAVFTAGAGRSEGAPATLPAAALAEALDVASGGPVDLGPPGRPTVVTFFATWCTPCRAQVRELDRLAAEAGARVLAVNVLESNPDVPASPHVHADGSVHYHPAPPPVAAVRSWLAGAEVDVPVVIADEAVVAAFGHVSRLPTTMVFDGEGRLAAEFVNAPTGPFVKPDYAALETALSASRRSR